MTAGSNLSRQPIVQLLLLVAALAAAAYLFANHGERADAAGNPPAAVQTTKPGAGDAAERSDIRPASALDTATQAAHRNGRAPTPPAPLPPADTNVADVFEELAERARRGDARAACWLGERLRRCAQAERSGAQARGLEEMAVRNPNGAPGSERTIAAIERFAAMNSQGCAGLERSQLEQAFAMQWQAAKAIPALRMAAVLTPALDRNNFLEHFDAWAEYRRNALPWLEQAAQGGDPAALVVLARVYGDHRPMVPLPPPFRLHDDAKFVLYSDLMARYGIRFEAAQADLDKARARLSPQNQADIAREVDARHDPALPRLSEDQVQQVLQPTLSPSREPPDCESFGSG